MFIHDSIHPRSTSIRRLGTQLVALAILSCAPLAVNTALAFAPDAPDPLPRAHEPIVPDTETQSATLHVPLRMRTLVEDVPFPTPIQQIGERLRELPLRPVSIGEAPRRPDDPEPGAGITVFIRF